MATGIQFHVSGDVDQYTGREACKRLWGQNANICFRHGGGANPIQAYVVDDRQDRYDVDRARNLARYSYGKFSNTIFRSRVLKVVQF